jgi:hypothetical protein
MRFFSARRWSLLAVVLLIGGVTIKPVSGGPVTFLNDYEGFLAAAGDVRVIDFETLPDGSPSHVGVPITPEFNYTSQGVTFSSPTGDPFIGGNPVSGFDLIADGYPDQRTWITADLSPAASAVGVFFVGFMELGALDAQGEVIAIAEYGGDGIQVPPFFVGILSDKPILRAIADSHNLVDFHSLILDFAFTPIPEPTTIVLLTLGAVAAARRRPHK